MVERRGIGFQADCWPGIQLPEILDADVDISSDVVRVVGFRLHGISGMKVENNMPESWSEAFDL